MSPPPTTEEWDEPYLETCCRAALHRLMLSGTAGRPDGMKDGRCLHRLAGMGFACLSDGRFSPTATGAARHRQEILREKAA
jgi:hypothetical protein